MEPPEADLETDAPWPRPTADVAVDGAFAGGGRGILTYALPDGLADRIGVGQLVWVPIRKSTSLGLVVAIEERAGFTHRAEKWW